MSHVAMITCPICQETYKKPRYLPCLHTFCESCLQRYINNIAEICQKLDSLPASIFDTKPYVWTGDGFPCPVCRNHVHVSEDHVKSVNIDQWALLFPVNHLILGIMGRSSKLQTENYSCGPCQRMEEPKTARKWCVDCEDALCETCGKHHQVLKATCKHTVLNITEVGDKKGFRSHEEINKCFKHDGKSIEMYCVDHNKVVCAECVIDDEHKACDNLITIDKVSGEIRDSAEAFKLLDKLKECNEETECVILDRKRNIDKLNANKDRVLKQVAEARTTINKVLDDLEEMFKHDIELSHAQVIEQLEDQIGRCHLLQKAVDSSKGILQAVVEHGTDNELFVVAHRMEKELHKYEAVLEKHFETVDEIDYDFQLNYEIEHVLMALDEIGTLKIQRIPTNVSPFINKKAFATTRFAATSAFDERCAELTGGTFMPDDRLLLVDNANEKLKLFTSDGELLSELELSSAPWDVTSVPGAMAAVSLPEEKKVLMVSGSNDCITPFDQFITSGKCYGIAYSYYTKDLILACDMPSDTGTTITALTLSGKKIRGININEDQKVRISRPSYIATNPFNSDVYLTDECNNTVTGFSMKDGHLRFRQILPYLKLPVGIAADNHGCVYVCGNGSCDIYQLSGDGQRIRLLLDGLPHPRAIAFDAYGDRCLVTSDGSFKSTVQIYNLS